MAAVSTELLSRKSFRFSAKFDRDTILKELGIDTKETSPPNKTEDGEDETAAAPSDVYEGEDVTYYNPSHENTKRTVKIADFQAEAIAHDRRIVEGDKIIESST